MSNEFWAVIGGAVVGAVVAGLISYILQRMSLNEAREQRKQESDARKQALAYSLMVRVIKAHNDIYHLSAHIKDTLELANSKNLENWQVYQPLAGTPDKINFLPEETALIFSLKEDDLFNLVIQLDGLHNSLIDIFGALDQKRNELASRVDVREMEGLAAKVSINPEEIGNVLPLMAEINQLVLDVHELSNRYLTDAQTVLDKLPEVLREKIGLPISVDAIAAKNHGAPAA